MSTLLDPLARQQLRDRFQTLRPDSLRQGGRMSPGGMVCHLTDSFLVCMGERDSATRVTLASRTLMRFVAISTPMPWPKGLPTGPAVDQEIGGSAPGDFDADVAELLNVMERFVAEMDAKNWAHPIFGAISAKEWGRWGWRHMDHHGRQFGI